MIKPYGQEVFMKVTNSKTFREAVKNRRKQLGYTQKDMSEFLGVSISFLSDLENGKKTIELEKALLDANTLGLDVELNERGQ
jgi:transcriptional regulator with XRE-family HTH domain